MNHREPHGNAKLTLTQVKAIRLMEGRLTARYVASLFGVGKQTILDIWSRRTWRTK